MQKQKMVTALQIDDKSSYCLTTQAKDYLKLIIREALEECPDVNKRDLAMLLAGELEEQGLIEESSSQIEDEIIQLSNQLES